MIAQHPRAPQVTKGSKKKRPAAIGDRPDGSGMGKVAFEKEATPAGTVSPTRVRPRRWRFISSPITNFNVLYTFPFGYHGRNIHIGYDWRPVPARRGLEISRDQISSPVVRVPKSKESRGRSVAKSISYRLICIAMLAIVTYAITADLVEMTLIVVVFQTIQSFVYYLHERAWERVDWGYQEAGDKA